jgi:hypothetical protein
MSGAHEWKEVVSGKKKVASLTSEDYETQVQLFLETFKTKMCTDFHEFNPCDPDYHTTFGDQRCNPFEHPYAIGESTGPTEKFVHPLIYKTKTCSDHKCKCE